VTLSGGDIRLIEVAKRIRSFEKIIITSPQGKQVCERSGLDVTYLITSNENEWMCKNVFLSYFIRIINALRLRVEILSRDVIYTSSDFLPDVFPAFVLKRRNKKTKWVQEIYHLIPSPAHREGSFLINAASFIAQRVSLCLIRRNADMIFVLNNMIRTQLVNLGFSKSRLYVTGAGINLAKIDQIQQSEGAAYDACFLGRLHLSKGIFDLIEIWKLVVCKKNNAKLAVIYIGPKDLESAMAMKVKEENLESNVFMLSLTGNDALSVVKSSKVFVFPSHEEGWGIAIAEAMACCLPVVAYDLSVYKEVFPQGMITVPLNNFTRFSQEALSLIENEEKRYIIGQQGRNQVTKYDWDSVAAKEVYLMETEPVK
jgi:glycosyltransferase involved in cell wall biosynthesis